MGTSDDNRHIPTELREAAQILERRETPPPIAVRELLRYFGAHRRGIYKVEEIRDTLNFLNLKTEPDFQDAWIDAEIRLALASTHEKSSEDIPSKSTKPPGVDGDADSEASANGTERVAGSKGWMLLLRVLLPPLMSAWSLNNGQSRFSY
jgi:hypothetical protein